MFKMKSRSFCSYLKEKLKNTSGYFGDNSSLHGVPKVLSLKPIPFYKRIFWLLILIASGVCASAILLQVLSLNPGGAVSYLIETDYLEFDTPFPAVTICEQSAASSNTMSIERIKAYVHDHKLPLSQIPFFKEVTHWNSKFCKTCATCKPNVTCMEDFAERVDSIRAKCKDLLTDCWWGDQPFKCCDRFKPIESEYGVCFTFNSRLTGNDSILYVNRKIGLPSLTFSAAEDVGIRIHSPDDMVSVGMENVFGRPVVLPLISDFDIIIKVEETVSDVSVTAMPPHVRGCLFKDERPAFAQAWPCDRYSFNSCILYCRASGQMQACNCTHHLMPTMNGFPKCDIQGLVCLNKNKDSLASVCDCPMSCEEISFKLIHMFFSRQTSKPSPELVKRGSRGQVRMLQLPTSRVRRTAIRHIISLVVDIGGVGGVFFGASLLSVIEIVYLCCIRTKK